LTGGAAGVTGPDDARLLLAFDYGTRRLGVATGNMATRTASPLTTLRVDRDVPWTELDQVVADWRPAQIVVGLPEGEGAAAVAARVRAFVAALERRYDVPVATVDETLTSVAAHGEIVAGRRSGYLRRRTGRESTDRVAACLIAEQWMSEN
jgi:putative Holliday junction resolvase